MQEYSFPAFHEQMQSAFPDFYTHADDYEKVGISLCLAPSIQPDLFDSVIRKEFGVEGDFPLIGGVRGVQHRGILPTGETWMYFCCQNHTAQRIVFINSTPEYLSHPQALLTIEAAPAGEPFLAGRLVFSNYFKRQFQLEAVLYEQSLNNLTLGGFIKSRLTLNDLILSPAVMNSIQEIRHWQHFHENSTGNELFLKRIKSGLKIAFYGKPGTGKTETAAIIGNELNKPVYRIDLSQIVSKYIGETEKNLAKIFEVAEHKQWILFFDEGDALFGKRTSVNSSNDRYANQEVAYLLQRIEDYTGIIIISTNFKENIDVAFMRRFQIITEFAMPDKSQRRQIWERLISEVPDYPAVLSEKEWEEISKTELSGGAITNIVNYALLKANYLKSGFDFTLLKEGIIRELRKENRLTSL